MAVKSQEWLILDFHGLGSVPKGIPEDEVCYWCPEETFRRILDTIPEVEEKSRIKIELTFDDGNISDAVIATPALAERGLAGTFFPCAGRIGQPNYLDGPAIKDMLSAGMKIGSHGWSHVDWRRVDDATLNQETSEARDRIVQETGLQVDSVAIPFGSYDRRVMGRLKDYKTIYTSDGYRTAKRSSIQPRLSYTSEWDSGTLLQAAMEPYSLKRRLRQRLTQIAKCLR